MPIPLMAIAGIAAQVGAPLMSKLLRNSVDGPAGELAGSMVDTIAGTLGVEPTSAAIETVYRTDPQAVGAAFRQAESDNADALTAIAGVAREVNKTMRAEHTAQGLLTRIWRPLFGIQFGIAFLAMALAVVRAIWTGDTASLNAMAVISGFLIAFYGMGASVLGVYVWQRSAEKKVGAV